MPYISIKAFPKDEGTVREVVDRINNVFLETWGCPQQAITISFEEVAPSEWDEKVKEPEILSNLDKMMILSGEKKYESSDS